VDGAMKFEPVDPEEKSFRPASACFYHYSRVGSPQKIAERVRNLDGFFHEAEKIDRGEVPPYEFFPMRKLDTYVVGAEAETAPDAQLTPFPIDKHPPGVREYFQR
jgi:hypothetical protein